MARPKVPLISKRNALEVALDIIDSEGIESLSIRRLAERLNINGASLYHHFANKDEIVAGAVALALEDVRAPSTGKEAWRTWILRNALELRQAFRAHPDLGSVMLRRDSLGIGTAQLDATVVMLSEAGVPEGVIAPMLMALELHAVGSTLRETHGGEPDPDQERALREAPNLNRAITHRAMSEEEIFVAVCAHIIETIMATTNAESQPIQPG
jgi:AcrR family transcriptional regulator